jgi:hypothetical protein
MPIRLNNMNSSTLLQQLLPSKRGPVCCNHDTECFGLGLRKLQNGIIDRLIGAVGGGEESGQDLP